MCSTKYYHKLTEGSLGRRRAYRYIEESIMASEDEERQLAELTLLASMFPDEFQWRYPPNGIFEVNQVPTAKMEALLHLNGNYGLRALMMDPRYIGDSCQHAIRLTLRCRRTIRPSQGRRFTSPMGLT
jgi:hypothetical protein